jgi:hypothetical protein
MDRRHSIRINISFQHCQQSVQSVTWQYFATSHGKGAVDGVGGEVKRMARSLVMSKRASIRCLDDLVTAVKPKNIQVSKTVSVYNSTHSVFLLINVDYSIQKRRH